MSVSSGFMGDDALAAGLVPGILSAPGGNILHILGSSTVAGRAPA